jgi:DNA-binding MarR family transcriptional regulator
MYVGLGSIHSPERVGAHTLHALMKLGAVSVPHVRQTWLRRLMLLTITARVLLTFSRTGRLPMRVMGERLQLHPTSVTNIVDRLQADGLVRRIPHPTDRRATLVEITEAGSSLLEAATKSVTAIDFGLSGLTPDEESQLTTLLGRVRQAAGDFEERDEQGRS